MRLWSLYAVIYLQGNVTEKKKFAGLDTVRCHWKRWTPTIVRERLTNFQLWYFRLISINLLISPHCFFPIHPHYLVTCKVLYYIWRELFYSHLTFHDKCCATAPTAKSRIWKKIQCECFAFCECVWKCGSTFTCELYQYLSVQERQAWGVLATRYSNTSLDKLAIDWLYQRGEMSSVSRGWHWSSPDRKRGHRYTRADYFKEGGGNWDYTLININFVRDN